MSEVWMVANGRLTRAPSTRKGPLKWLFPNQRSGKVSTARTKPEREPPRNQAEGIPGRLDATCSVSEKVPRYRRSTRSHADSIANPSIKLQ